MRWLVAVAGLGLIITSLAADLLTGAALSAIGWKQALGCLAGLMLVLGALVSAMPRARRGSTVRWLIAFYLAACSLTLSLVEPKSAATWILLGYVAASCALLPLHFGILTLFGVVGLHALLTWVSQAKADLTGLPLTVLDIRIAMSNPSGLWAALSLPNWTRFVAIAVGTLALLGWAVTGLSAGRRFLKRPLRHDSGFDALGRLVGIGTLGFLALAYLDALYADMGTDSSTWHPDRVVRLANTVGVLPFIAYSYHIEADSIGYIYRSGGSATPPSAKEVESAVLKYMYFVTEIGSATVVKPNIIVVLAESTFDPALAFRLHGRWNGELFTRHQRTAALGPLRVNAVGGGTWITEFETIVGLDSRLFGYSGSYTHASLSPFVVQSIATYVRERGYQTWAFFPHGGDFYNARYAYERYGFQSILDSENLGSGESWIENDVTMANKVKQWLGAEPQAPLFAYVLFVENHSPHECQVDADSFTARFADSDKFAPNCALHEYLRRLDSTTAAVRSLTDYLAAIEARTGRPFVLLVFGDHQPATFTGSIATVADYRPMRRPSDMHTTFFHILSSTPRRMNCCMAALPASVLPTLLSGFVAKGPDDVYLGVNLWLFDQCGPDAIRRDFAANMATLEVRSTDERTDTCDAAFERALAAYRATRIMRLTDSTENEPQEHRMDTR